MTKNLFLHKYANQNARFCICKSFFACFLRFMLLSALVFLMLPCCMLSLLRSLLAPSVSGRAGSPSSPLQMTYRGASAASPSAGWATRKRFPAAVPERLSPLPAACHAWRSASVCACHFLRISLRCNLWTTPDLPSRRSHRPAAMHAPHRWRSQVAFLPVFTLPHPCALASSMGSLPLPHAVVR